MTLPKKKIRLATMPAKKTTSNADYPKTMRMKLKIHQAAKIAAAHEGVSVQDWIERAIKSRIENLGLGVLLKPPALKKSKR